MAPGVHAHRGNHRAAGLQLSMNRESRASAQARIAASAPKTTYGKHKNALLSLTGSHFLPSDIFIATNDRDGPAAANVIAPRADYYSSDADDSPLSDAEPITQKRQPKSVVAPLRRVSVLTPKSKARLHRTEAGDVPGGQSVTGEEPTNAHSHSPQGVKSTTKRRRSRHTTLSAQKKGKLKPIGVSRGRLPLNELVLIPSPNHDDCFVKSPRTDRDALARDPISSSAQQLLDPVSSGASNATPAKRKAKAPLSAIRKRLRTPSSGYKSIERLRRRYHASQITPTGSQHRQAVGDGFEQSELTPSHRSRYATKHIRKHHEPLLVGLQALSLASGPLPDVVFTRETSASQLDFAGNLAPKLDNFAQVDDVPAVATDSSIILREPSYRQVSFKSSIDLVVSAQLASVSAPRRERIVSMESEDDGGDEGEEDEDDEAADTYLDEDEPPPGEDQPALSEDDIAMQSSSPEASPEPRSHTRFKSHFFRSPSASERHASDKFVSRGQSRVPSFRRCNSSEKPRLNQVNENIDDDFRIDDMLLGNPDDYHDAFEHSNAGPVHTTKPHPLNIRTHSRTHQPASRQNTSQNQTRSNRLSSIQPRSILKNSTPQLSSNSNSNKPSSTAANTRRNSTIAIEESGYFSAAIDQLDTDSSPTKPAIIRKKSSSRFYAPIEVPYTDDMMPETSPRKLDYADRSQSHTLRRTGDAVWTSSAVPVPLTDLRSLTRSVSRENGTLSQSVRRRRSMPFQSPIVGR